MPNFKGMGIDGAAVVSAVVSQPDIEKAAKDHKRKSSSKGKYLYKGTVLKKP